jgi:hypothetical protein
MSEPIAVGCLQISYQEGIDWTTPVERRSMTVKLFCQSVDRIETPHKEKEVGFSQALDAFKSIVENV